MQDSVKRRGGLRAEQAAQTRVRILDAAREVFERCGYAGARIEDIADSAGVAVPTVYKGFGNKRTLLIGAVQRAMTGRTTGPMSRNKTGGKSSCTNPIRRASYN